MNSEDGELFVKQLATYVRTHEKALANALPLRRQNGPRHTAQLSTSTVPNGALPASSVLPQRPSSSSSTTISIVTALSLGSLGLTSPSSEPNKLSLTPHHLFYLLSRFEDLGIPVGPMKVRLENIHVTSSSTNYVSFLGQSQRTKSSGSDVGSIRSVSSIRSVVFGLSSLWANFGLGSSISAARIERQKAAFQADLKYLYSSFTKIPSLRLAPDWRSSLIRGYEEFPFDSAVPLYIFKNVQSLEVSDLDFRHFFGWDRMADQLRSLTVRRASIDDIADIIIDIVLDDMDKMRKRTSKTQTSPSTAWAPTSSPVRGLRSDRRKSISTPQPPSHRHSYIDPSTSSLSAGWIAEEELSAARFARRPSFPLVGVHEHDNGSLESYRPRSHSPRPKSTIKKGNSHPRNSPTKFQRSSSGSSSSSISDSWSLPQGSPFNLPSLGILPVSKWRFLRHLSLTDNSLAALSGHSLSPLTNTLHSLDLSCNLFSQIPHSLSNLTVLRSLNLSHCMIDSLNSLTRNPLPAITALNLRGNRLQSIAGIENLCPLERLDLRDNNITNPMEAARLTSIPEIREIWLEGNPFTRTHRDYRITIFNLFRKSPGYVEDIKIDATGPTYLERRHLANRVAENPAVPVVKPAVPQLPVVDVKPATAAPDGTKGSVTRKDKPLVKAVSKEVNPSPSRRRRAPKRRVVDLATNDLPPMLPLRPSRNPSSTPTNHKPKLPATARDAGPTNPAAKLEKPLQPPDSLLPSAAPHLPGAPKIDENVLHSPSHADSVNIPSQKEPQDWDIGVEMYRIKIEALRGKVGNGYLSALADDSQPSCRDMVSTSTLHSNSSPRVVTVQTFHHGRPVAS